MNTVKGISNGGGGTSPTSLALAVGALGVVFGDIGTSPLYTMKAVMTSGSGLAPEPDAIFGVLSMITWCLVIVVAFTYVGVITRADNEGEGGILALASFLLRRAGLKRRTKLLVVGIAATGAALFLGDSLITPAISVLSAVEGLVQVDKGFVDYVVPLAAGILVALFAVQRRGTEGIGKVFGPVMAVWFIVMGAIGVVPILDRPEILGALSPYYALSFAQAHPMAAFLALGACVLAVTGAEALYADLGHFGRPAVVHAWYAIVLPCLLLNYFGQGALMLDDPRALSNPFFALAPPWARLAVVVLATAATVVASQAVISGAFSVVRQAVRLSLLPRFKVVQTSEYRGGQVYLPAVNAFLFVGVLLLVFFMRSSESLAAAYGIAITATLVLELTLFLVFAHVAWHWGVVRIALMIAVVGAVELLLFLANTLKIASGGWFPLAIAVALVTIMATWNRGAAIIFGKRRALEGDVADLVEKVARGGIARIPGAAIYPHGNVGTVPLALRSSVMFSQALHEHVVIVTMVNAGVPHVDPDKRVRVDGLGNDGDGIVQIVYSVGFKDSQDIPAAVNQAVGSCSELTFDVDQAWYVLSVYRLEPESGEHIPGWPRWQRRLFRLMERASSNRTSAFHLPPERTIVSGIETVV